MISVLIAGRGEYTGTQRGRAGEDGGRDWMDAVTSQEHQGTGTWPRQETILLWNLCEKMALSIPRFQTSGLQSCERINFCFKPSSSWYFVKTALGN